MKYKNIVKEHGEIEDELVASIMASVFSDASKYPSGAITEVAFINVYKYIKRLEKLAHA